MHNLMTAERLQNMQPAPTLQFFTYQYHYLIFLNVFAYLQEIKNEWN